MAKVLLKVGDPKRPTTPSSNDASSGSKSTIDTGFDLRDRLSELVTRGNGLSPDDKAAIYGSLESLLGKGRAQKIMNHAYIFNTRPEVQRLPLEEKLKSFYTVGSNDPEVMEVIRRTKTLGYGVAPGFRESVSDLNQQTLDRNRSAIVGTATPEVQRKIMLRTSR
jgi:hypothetical protein